MAILFCFIPPCELSFCQVFQLKFNLIYCYKLSLFIYCLLGYVALELTEVETETDALRKVI